MIIITGASDGLGRELAVAFRRDGKKVVNLSRTENENTDNVICDLTDSDSVKNAIQVINDMPEKIEVFINCAGVMSLEPLEEITASEISKTFLVNVMGPMLLTSGLAHKIRQDEGDIVNIASTVGTKAYESQAAYGSSKWAMRGFSQNLQLEFKDTKVRVMSICVGGFNSRIAEKAGNGPIQDPGKWMNPGDIAKAIKQFLELPKNMEISEVVINRR